MSHADGIGAITGATPAASKPETGVTVRIETGGGQPLGQITKDQPFNVVVERPRPSSGTPEGTITVTFRGPDGSTHTLILKWDGGVKGPVRYVSEPVTIAHGADGGASITLPSPVRVPGSAPTGVEFSAGGMYGASLPILGLDVPNGGTLTVTAGSGPGAASAQVTVFDSVNKMVIDFNQRFFVRAREQTITLIEKVKRLPKSQARDDAMKRATHKIDLLDRAMVDLNNPNLTDIDTAIRGSEWVRIILDPYWITAAYSDVAFRMRQADGWVEQKKREVLWTFVTDVVIGYYQLVMSQIPLAGSLWTVLFGQDILGNKVSGWERVVAALDLAGQGATMALPVAVNAETNVRTTVSERPTEIRVEVHSAEPTTAKTDITTAKLGTKVEWTEDFGIEGVQAQKFNAVVEKWSAIYSDPNDVGGLPHRRIVVLVRRTGKGALGRALEGHSVKAEALKAKTNNPADMRGGWGMTEDVVAYYTPEQIATKLGVTPEDIIKAFPDPDNPGETKWIEGARPADADPVIWKRAGQRIREYWDEKPMIDELLEKKLIEIRPDGVILDRGVSNYTLDPETHKLRKTFDGPPNGTGKPIYGDPDLYGFFWEDGKPLTVEEIAPIVKDLGPQWVQTPDGWQAGGARVMHPDIFSWDPHEPKNIRIKSVIMDGVKGTFFGWKFENGRYVPVGEAAPGSEGLVAFRGYTQPPQVAYGDVPLPTPAFKGRTFGRATQPAGRAPTPSVKMPFFRIPSGYWKPKERSRPLAGAAIAVGAFTIAAIGFGLTAGASEIPAASLAPATPAPSVAPAATSAVALPPVSGTVPLASPAPGGATFVRFRNDLTEITISGGFAQPGTHPSHTTVFTINATDEQQGNDLAAVWRLDDPVCGQLVGADKHGGQVTWPHSGCRALESSARVTVIIAKKSDFDDAWNVKPGSPYFVYSQTARAGDATETTSLAKNDALQYFGPAPKATPAPTQVAASGGSPQRAPAPWVPVIGFCGAVACAGLCWRSGLFGLAM